MKQNLVIIAGPTASGKTALGIKIAKLFNGEIISADSMQIYKQLNINTAKATKEEQEQVPHHLIDIVNPDEEFSVTDFVDNATSAINDISSRGKLPIVVGGTGMYIKSLLYPYSFGNSHKDECVREKYQKYLDENGIDALHKLLQQVDPISANEIHKNNTKRVIRALEIYDLTGVPKSEQKDEIVESKYNAIVIVLDLPRADLYSRINKRVDLMVEKGGIEEAKFVYYDLNLEPNAQCLQAIGYKEFLPYLQGKKTLHETKDDLAKATRHYAKRQLTYFRNFKEAIWLNPLTQKKEIISYIKDKLRKW